MGTPQGRRPKPLCPTCGGPAPKPRPIQKRAPKPKPVFSPERAQELAREILASLPAEPAIVIAGRKRDLLRDTASYHGPIVEVAHSPGAMRRRGPGGVIRWVAA